MPAHRDEPRGPGRQEAERPYKGGGQSGWIKIQRSSRPVTFVCGYTPPKGAGRVWRVVWAVT